MNNRITLTDSASHQAQLDRQGPSLHIEKDEVGGDGLHFHYHAGDGSPWAWTSKEEALALRDFLIQHFPYEVGEGVVGSTAYVVGNRNDAHYLEIGQEVRVVDDSDYLKDGTYEVSPVDDADFSQWVYAEDLDVEPLPEPDPTFEVGDRVVQVAEHYFANSEFGTGYVYHESPDGIGSTGTVTHTDCSRGPNEHVAVQWDNSDRGSVIATRSLAAHEDEEPAAPSASEEDREVTVRVTYRRGFNLGDYVEHTTGNKGEIVEFPADRKDDVMVSWEEGCLAGSTCQAAVGNLKHAGRPEASSAGPEATETPVEEPEAQPEPVLHFGDRIRLQNDASMTADSGAIAYVAADYHEGDEWLSVKWSRSDERVKTQMDGDYKAARFEKDDLLQAGDRVYVHYDVESPGARDYWSGPATVTGSSSVDPGIVIVATDKGNTGGFDTRRFRVAPLPAHR